ncbi:hypothetical protein [Rhodococcus koreensis]|uniref:hypothetical protein n=1 Tax=Rhodococcus koreensis TaxID=99653 RepID=UPI00366CD952
MWDLHKSTGAGAALREGRESLRGNLRSPGWTKVGGSQIYHPIATVLDDTLLYASVLEVAAEVLTDADDRTAGNPDSEHLRHEAAALLEAFSAAFDELTWDPAHRREPYLHVVQTALPEARSRLESFDDSVRRHQPLPGAWPAIALAADGLWAALAVLDISGEH